MKFKEWKKEQDAQKIEKSKRDKDAFAMKIQKRFLSGGVVYFAAGKLANQVNSR